MGKTYHDWGETKRKESKYKDDPDKVTYECVNCGSIQVKLEDGGSSHIIKNIIKSPTCSEKAKIIFKPKIDDRNLPSPEKIRKQINKIEDPEIRVLCKILYLYAPRIGETVQLQKKDFEVTNKFLIISRDIFKRKKSSDGRRPHEKTSMPLRYEFTKEIIEWFSKLKKNDYLFPHRVTYFGGGEIVDYSKHISQQNARIRIKKHIKYNPHFYRHLRLTHLAPYMRTMLQLKTISHHDSESSLNKYLHLMSSIYTDDLPVE